MKFRTFLLITCGLTLVGVSIGYILGFYVSNYTLNDNYFYLSVLFMALGSAMIIYGSLFEEKKK